MSASNRFRLPTDPTEIVSWSNDWDRISRVALPGGGELLYAKAICGAYEDELWMTRFGARCVDREVLIGVVYGYVFRVRPGFEPPSAEVFYDWCDSASDEAAALARWVLDASAFAGLFDDGDVLAIDAYEFLRDVPADRQRAALHAVARALKKRFRRLGQAVITVHPHQLGTAPKANADARRVTTYRRALERLLPIATDVRLGAVLRPKAPSDDRLVVRGHPLSFDEELLELVRRTRASG